MVKCLNCLNCLIFSSANHNLPLSSDSNTSSTFVFGLKLIPKCFLYSIPSKAIVTGFEVSQDFISGK